MKFNIMPCRHPLLEKQWPLQMKRGLERHGHTVEISQTVSNADVHVFWGLRRRWGKQALREGRPSLVVERAYLGDRFNWAAIGWDGLNGRADFCNADVSGDRWDKHWADYMRPWQPKPGGYALVIGQVPGDAALRGLNMQQWVYDAVAHARRYYEHVYFRPHPKARRLQRIAGIPTMEGELADALAGAAVVVTYNSNTGVDAVMAGIPATSADVGAMAWDVTTRGLSEPLFTGDRTRWAHRMAYTQWLPAEIERGEPWEHLRQYLEDR